MADSHSSGNRPRQQKPRPDWPLFFHASGQWCKKVRGRHIYFGTDADAALRLWLAEKDDWLAGRDPRRQVRRNATALELAQGCNIFLTAINEIRKAKGQTLRNFMEKRDALEMLTESIGRHRFVEELEPHDFQAIDVAIRQRYGRAGQRKAITHVKHMFLWLFDSGYIIRPVRFGRYLEMPSLKDTLRERNAKGKRFFEPELARRILDLADQPMKSFVLLAINSGLGNLDIGLMRYEHADLNGGWLDYPRNKTNEPRRAKLWNETVDSIREYLKQRREPRDGLPSDLLFTTVTGLAWGSVDESRSPISNEFRKLLRKHELYRPNLSFYVLRSTFRTVADGCRDQGATDLVMGHASKDIGSKFYRAHLQDEQQRLESVADYVHAWLFGEEARP